MQAQATARAIRNRLRNPPNAVEDKPISLVRPPQGLTGSEIERRKDLERRAAAERESEKQTADRPPTIEKSYLSSRCIVRELDRGEPTLADVLSAVCAFGYSAMDIKSTRRDSKCLGPRHVTALLCKILTKRSLPQIGMFLGGRDHSTILHSCRKLEPVENRLRSELDSQTPLLVWAMYAIEYASTMEGILRKKYTRKVPGREPGGRFCAATSAGDNA